MPVCKDDGSSDDFDVSGISGLGDTTEAWNGESCKIQANTFSKEENKNLTDSVISYLKDKDTSKLTAIYQSISARGPARISGGPLATIGGGGDDFTVEYDSTKPFSFGNIINVKNIRVAGFPDFIMDWWARQSDEIVNKFFTLPNLVVIPPTSLGPNAEVDGSLASYGKIFDEQATSLSIDGLQKNMGNAFQATNVVDDFNKKTTSGNNPVSEWYNN